MYKTISKWLDDKMSQIMFNEIISDTKFFTSSNKRIDMNIKLKEIRKLCKSPNWNLYNAKPVKSHTIKVAKKVLNNFITVPKVFPLPDGGIQFEFDYNNIYLEFQLIPINKKEYKLEWEAMDSNYVTLSSGIISSRDYVKMNEIILYCFI